MFWIAAWLQAALWLMVPLLLYRSPPGDLADRARLWPGIPGGNRVSARRWRSGSPTSRFAPRAIICSASICWRSFARSRRSGRFYLLARAIVGGTTGGAGGPPDHDGRGVQFARARVRPSGAGAAALGTVAAAFLAVDRPDWRNAWFAWSIEVGLLLLTTSAAIRPVALVAGFALATARGRRTLMSFDPLFALLVIVVLVLPYLVWLIRAGGLALPHWPAICRLGGRARIGPLGGLLLAISGILVAGGAQLRLAQSQSGRGADHLSAAGRSAGARFCLFLRHRPRADGQPGLRPVRSRSRRGRDGRRVVDVGPRRDRRDWRSGSAAAPAPAAPGLDGRHHRARACGTCDHDFSALDRRRRGGDFAARAAIANFFGDSFERRTNPRCGRWPAIRSSRP